jgi:hypothetical protein
MGWQQASRSVGDGKGINAAVKPVSSFLTIKASHRILMSHTVRRMRGVGQKITCSFQDNA